MVERMLLRLILILILIAGASILSLEITPIIWQMFREHQHRQEVKQNLEQIQQALDVYQNARRGRRIKAT